MNSQERVAAEVAALRAVLGKRVISQKTWQTGQVQPFTAQDGMVSGLALHSVVRVLWDGETEACYAQIRDLLVQS